MADQTLLKAEHSRLNFIVEGLLIPPPQAGKDGKTTVFLLTDTQIKQESFLEDVDGLLNAGEVPNLFAIDEKQEIVEVNHYIRITSWNYVIIMSSVGDATDGTSREQGRRAYASFTLQLLRESM